MGSEKPDPTREPPEASDADAPGADAPVAVALAGVSKRYGGTAAVENVDLRIREGEFFTLVGPSGCGKTTTLRLIAGFEAPTAGAIRFGGCDVSGVPPEDRNVGVVFQNYALFPHMTVGENVGYGLRFSDPPGGVSRDQRVRNLLDLVDLPGSAGRDPENLSGGQQQRVAIARALAPGPDLLLLDEPMSALDAALRERLRGQLRDIQTELGVTTLYVTHDQQEALAVSDRVGVMQDGHLEQVGTPRELYHQPESRFVAEFVGDNNLLEGEVRAVEDGLARLQVASLEFAIADPGELAPGDRLTVCVRPERLALGAETNALEARVRRREFLGATTRLHLDSPVGPLVARTDAAVEEPLTVGFDPADAHVLDHR